MRIRRGKGRWTIEEHEGFLKGLDQYGRNWEAIRTHVPTRTIVQIRTHSQKYFEKKGRGEPFPEQPYESMHASSTKGTRSRGTTATSRPGSSAAAPSDRRIPFSSPTPNTTSPVEFRRTTAPSAAPVAVSAVPVTAFANGDRRTFPACATRQHSPPVVSPVGMASSASAQWDPQALAQGSGFGLVCDERKRAAAATAAAAGEAAAAVSRGIGFGPERTPNLTQRPMVASTETGLGNLPYELGTMGGNSGISALHRRPHTQPVSAHRNVFRLLDHGDMSGAPSNRFNSALRAAPSMDRSAATFSEWHASARFPPGGGRSGGGSGMGGVRYSGDAGSCVQSVCRIRETRIPDWGGQSELGAIRAPDVYQHPRVHTVPPTVDFSIPPHGGSEVSTPTGGGGGQGRGAPQELLDGELAAPEKWLGYAPSPVEFDADDDMLRRFLAEDGLGVL